VKDDIVLAVPSRERPGNIARLWDTMEKTCRAGTELVVGLDEDDPALLQYPAGPAYRVRSGLRQVVAWINELAVPLAREYRYIGHVGDDNVFKTVGWDVRVREALEKTPFAFGNDLYPRPPGSLCCHIFCRSEVVTALGYLGPPCLRHMYVDPVWMAWGKATGITYLHEVIIEHLHFTAGKSPYDLNYASSAACMGSDFEAYREYCRSGQLNADARKIDPAGRQYTPDELRIFQQGLSIPW
jgi:hypothetical protein